MLDPQISVHVASRSRLERRGLLVNRLVAGGGVGVLPIAAMRAVCSCLRVPVSTEQATGRRGETVRHHTGAAFRTFRCSILAYRFVIAVLAITNVSLSVR